MKRNKDEIVIPPRNVFDHIKHIRGDKTEDYVENLSESDVGTFNKYIITMGIGFDPVALDEATLLSKYMDIFNVSSYYTVARVIVPRSRNFYKWIKSSAPKAFKPELIKLVAEHYKISTREAKQYCSMMIKSDTGLSNLTDICGMHGMADDEIEKLFDL
jgi:hypothetical protein